VARDSRFSCSRAGRLRGGAFVKGIVVVQNFTHEIERRVPPQMKPLDTTSSHPGAARYPLRTSMLLLAVAIGVAAVVMLTAVGGARRYVTDRSRSLGSISSSCCPASPHGRAAAYPVS
jgi:hypothetical protein